MNGPNLILDQICNVIIKMHHESAILLCFPYFGVNQSSCSILAICKVLRYNLFMMSSPCWLFSFPCAKLLIARNNFCSLESEWCNYKSLRVVSHSGWVSSKLIKYSALTNIIFFAFIFHAACGVLASTLSLSSSSSTTSVLMFLLLSNPFSYYLYCLRQ